MQKPGTMLLTALLVAASGFMELLDTTIITTAIPRMAESFHVHPIDLNLGVTAYVIMLAAAIPLSGWAADRFGGRRVFATAIAIFTGASALCGLSHGLWSFFGARVLQGIGGAMMVPVGRLLVLRVTPKSDLMRMTALITWPALVAPILGPFVGGLLTTYASWRWIFFLNVPLGLCGLVATFLIIRHGRGETVRRLDVPGAILSGISAVAFVYGASLAGTASGNLTTSIGLMLLGGLAAWATVWHAGRTRMPLIEFSALGIQSFRATVAGGSLIRLGINAAPFLLPLLFQLGFHRSPVQAGSLLLVLFVGNLAIKPLTTPMMRTFGFRSVLILDGLLLALTFLGFALIDAATPGWIVLPLLLISGMARSVAFTAMNTLVYADVPPERMSSANTLFNLAQQVTFGLGVALGAIMLRFGHAVLGGPQTTVADFRFAFVGIFIVTLLGLLDVLGLPHTAGAQVSGHGASPQRGN